MSEARLTAVALDASLDLGSLHAQPPWSLARRSAYGVTWHHRDGGRAWLFRFGAVVLEEVEDATRERLRELVRPTQRVALEESADRWRVREHAGQNATDPRVGWDEIVVEEFSPSTLDAIALLLGQSAALERYEATANVLVEEVQGVARGLSQRGLPPRRDRTLIRRMGAMLAKRLELARLFFLVDRPDAAWDVPAVSALYPALFRQLELRERHEAVLHKLDAVAATVESTLTVLHARRANLLEVWIVLLILVEIVMFLAGMG